MKLIAAYLLLQIGGNASPSAADIKALLEVVGIEAEDERLDKLISELEGKDVNQVSCLSWFKAMGARGERPRGRGGELRQSPTKY
jgi:ribosomal protein L12E/L44/L45/RPP1/RPP2